MEAGIVAVPEWTAVTPRRLARLFRAREMRVEGKGIAVQVVERELAGPIIEEHDTVQTPCPTAPRAAARPDKPRKR
jgi:hypothetical protein